MLGQANVPECAVGILFLSFILFTVVVFFTLSGNLFIPDTKFRIYNYMLVVYTKLDSGYSNILFYL